MKVNSTLLLYLLLNLTLASASDPFLIRSILSQKKESTIMKRDGDHIASLYSNKPTGYYMTVNIGTPSKAIQVLIDTGSSNLIIPTTACPRTQCKLFELFDPTQSSTFQNSSNPLDVSFVKGNTRGYFGTETVTIAGISLNNIIVGFATQQQALSTGIFGLGYPSITQYDVNPFFFQLQEHRLIQQSIFSIYFDKKSTDVNNRGELIFGGIDNTKYTGNLTSTAVMQQEATDKTMVYATWDVLGQRTSIVGADGNVVNTSIHINGDNVKIDTGSSYCSLPQATMDSIMSVFQHDDYQFSNGMYAVTCHQPYYANYTVQFTIGHHPEQFIHLNIPLSELIVPDDSKPLGCVLGVIANENYFILGLTVIDHYYMVFDSHQHIISFAPIVGSNGTITF